MMKPCLRFILSIAAVFLLAACGGAEPTATASPTPAPTSTPAPASAATSAPAPASTDTPRSDPAPTTPPTANSDLGILEVRITAQPTEVVTSSLVTVRNIEVRVSGDTGEWSTVVAEPQQFGFPTFYTYMNGAPIRRST